MALTQAAKNTIGVVGVAFGLTSALFDATVSSVLYELPAASVNSVVQAQRAVLRMNEQAMLTSIGNQGQARTRLTEYILYCSPVTIEANITKLLSTARAEDATNNLTSGSVPAAVTSSFVISAGVSRTTAGAALRQFARDPALSREQRNAHSLRILQTARSKGITIGALGSWIENPPEGEAEIVARSLGLIR